jgi:ABC-type uncharacterized transport system involved in gliding motility auxiliary subunit
MTHQPRGKTLVGSSIAAFLIVAAIVVAVNVLFSQVVWRLDLTEDRIYTLSEGTREVLAELDGPVTLKLFFNSSDPMVPPQLRTYARQVEDLLREYEIASRGRIVLEKYDPVPDSDAADWARRYGIEPQPVGFFGPDVTFGLAATKGADEAVIPFLNPEDQERLEYDITRLIARVAKPKRPVVGLISSIPVMGGFGMPFGPMAQPQRGWFAFTDLEKDYEVRQLGENVEEISSDVDVLVIVHPKNLSDRTLYAIDQYLLRGGRILAFLDPLAFAEDRSRGPMGFSFGGEGSSLGALLPAWGITFDNSKVVADLSAVTPVRGPDNRVVENPVWLSLRPEHLNKDDRLTARLESLLLVTPGSFKVEPPEGVTAVTLMKTSEHSAQVDSIAARFGSESLRKDLKLNYRSEVLAVRLTGRFKTAFPNGVPGSETNTTSGTTNAVASSDSASTNAPTSTSTNAAVASPSSTNTAASGQLKVSEKDGLVVVVADVDMLYDNFCLRELRVFGQTAYTPFNDNLTFFFGVVEELIGGARLAQIRSRGRMDRPFEVVARMLARAQEQYMAEERALEEKLQQTRQRLEELQAQKGGGQTLLLTPEQRAEIEKFRKQELETRQRLKEVRKNLRRDIERLGAVIKAINILGMPIVVGLAGIGFGLWRRHRATQAA